MFDRRRKVTLAWAGVCAGLFLVLALLVHLQRAPLGALDDLGRSAEQWTSARPGVQSFLRGIEIAFGTVGMTIMTILIAVPLLVRGHRRAAVFTVGVMISTTLLTTAIKAFYGRGRPTWQDPVGGVLTSKSFPSGHASSTAALAGILIVLATMLIREAVLRRTVYAAVVLMALIVGLDRVFLGRHYPTDVIAGWLLGACVVLVWLAFYSPLPPTNAETADTLTGSRPSDMGLP